ncbi:MAG: acyl-CoA dehydrogenase family protein [Coriobacteriia bacterium]|nr:acyl-CoA dehydrogenase family protein [Coriobacteriia bacterium]
MNFGLSDEQRELVSKVREFGERTFTQDRVAQWCRDGGLPDAVVREFAELYFSIEGPVESEHFTNSIMTQALVLEELSRCAGATLPFQNELFNLQIMGGFAERETFLRILGEYRATGRLMFSMAVSEPHAGSDTMSMKTNTRMVDGKILLNGQKTYVNNGEFAPNTLVAAIDLDAEQDKYPPLTFWLVPSNLPGISKVPIDKMGQKMLPFASMSFEDVELKPEYRLTGNDGGFRQLFHLLEFGRVFTCASSLGMAQAAMEDAVEFARTRKAFGTPIVEFQQIGQLITDMEVSLTNMRTMLYRAVWAIETEQEDKRLAVGMCKRYIPQAATKVASDAMQIMGGSGYTESCRVSRIWEDCRGNQIAEGTDQIMVYILAPLIMEKYA